MDCCYIYPGVDKAKEKAFDINAKLQQALEIIDDKNKQASKCKKIRVEGEPSKTSTPSREVICTVERVKEARRVWLENSSKPEMSTTECDVKSDLQIEIRRMHFERRRYEIRDGLASLRMIKDNEMRTVSFIGSPMTPSSYM